MSFSYYQLSKSFQLSLKPKLDFDCRHPRRTNDTLLPGNETKGKKEGTEAIATRRCKSTAYQLTPAVLLADLHAQERDADARARTRRRWSPRSRPGRSRRRGRRPRRPGRPRRGPRGRRRARRHDDRQRGQAAPVPAVPQVLLQQSPARPAHQGAHGREAVQVQLLRQEVQAAQPRPTAHEATHRSVAMTSVLSSILVCCFTRAEDEDLVRDVEY